ncbi:MAG: hypothetical protein HYZ74_02005, partial [Elusimicrobia bacterium]|nr:hypothetical protein [Elusimicrobiota bacterium]
QQLLFWAALGLWGITLPNRIVAFAVAGAAMGACGNTKLHGVLYLAPVLALAIDRARYRDLAAFLAAGLLALALPFLACATVSLRAYVAWLQVASHHGLNAKSARDVLMTSALIFIPVLLAAAHRAASLPRERLNAVWASQRRGIVLAAGALALLMLAASKYGGGSWHLLPLLPAGAYLIAVALNDARPEGRSKGYFLAALAPFAVIALMGSLLGVAALPLRLSLQDKDRMIRDDVRAIARKYRGASIGMGCGARATYAWTFFRTEIQEGDFILDTAALMDMQQGGIELPLATEESLRSGKTKFWLIPKGDAPFSIDNWYHRRDLFGPRFRKAFLDHYRKIESTAYFDVWAFSPL